MNEIRTLLLLELRSFYGINKFLHTKDQKLKKKYKRLGIVWVIIIGMLFAYIGGLVIGLYSLGLAEIVPTYLALLSSALIVFFGMFSAGNRIFTQRGYDILVSMPIKPNSVVISRFLGLYIADLVLTSVVSLPGIAVYGYLINPNITFYLMSLISIIFIPLIPLTLSVLFGSFVLAISSRMKNKSMVQSALSVLFVVGVMVLSFGMGGVAEELTVEQITNLANTVNGILAKAYPPAAWASAAIMNGDIIKLLLFIAVSLLAAVLTIFVVSSNFNRISRGLLSFTAKHNYKIGKMGSRSIVKSLYMREAKRYFSSSIYVTNTIVGPVLGTIMAVAVCVLGIDSLKSSIPLPIDIEVILPFVFSAVFCIMTTTSVSISMEGKQFWIVKSLPISSKELFDSKILFNLSLLLPFYLVSEVAMAVAVKPTFIELIRQIIIPLSIMLFVTVFGITVNLKSHSFDWEQEAAVVKQSLAAAVGGFAGFFLSVILIGVVFVTPAQYNIAVISVICIVLWLATALLYRANNKTKLTDL